MSTAALKVLLGAQHALVSPTVMAIVGRNVTWNMGTGWHRKGTGIKSEPSFVGGLVKNAQQVSFGYGGAACLMADGHLQIFGQNIGGAHPSSVGPEAPWCGEWGYRYGLAAQKELEAAPWESSRTYGLTSTNAGFYTNLTTEGGKTYESVKAENKGNKPSTSPTWWKETTHSGLTRSAIEAKERELVFTRANPNGVANYRKALPGQLVFAVGQAVLDEGHTYEATAENVGKKPSEHPECWTRTPIDVATIRFVTAGGVVTYSVRRHNLVAPIQAPQVKNVLATVTAGSHDLYLLRDGTVRMAGHTIRFGGGGADFDGSEGPPPRPLLPPPQIVNHYKGTLTKGSKIITMPEGIQIRQRSEPKFECGFGKATSIGSAISLPSHTELKISAEGTASYSVPTAAANVAVTENPGPGTATVKAISSSECLIELAGYTAGTNVIIGFSISNILPPETTLTAVTTESLPIEPPGSRGPQERVLTLELSHAAEGNYTGRIQTQKPGKESKFWAEGILYREFAIWPVTPILPPGVTVAAIAAGSAGGSYNLCLALAQTGTTTFNGATVPVGRVLAWGSNQQGQMGTGIPIGSEHFEPKAAYVQNPEGTGDLENIVAIACCGSTSIALDTSHRIYVWGSVDEGLGGAKLDEESKGKQGSPLLLEHVPTTVGERPVAIAGSSATGYFIDESGSVWAWGSNKEGECANGEHGKEEKQWKSGHAYNSGEIVYDKGANWKAKSAVTSSTHPESDPTHWELVNHPTQPIPHKISGLSNINFVAGGGRRHAAAVTKAGELFCWGSNENGTIGNGEVSETPVMSVYHVPFPGRRVLSAACSEYNTAAVIEGSAPAAPNIVKLTLLPVGEATGEEGDEQVAHLRIELQTTCKATGWTMKFKRSATPWEKAEITDQLEELGAAEYGGEGELQEVQNGELTEEGVSKSQLEKRIEEEIAALEIRLTNLGGTIETIHPVFTVIEETGKPRVLRYDWVPPGALTPNSCYEITDLKREDEEPWTDVTIETEGLFSPYVLA